MAIIPSSRGVVFYDPTHRLYQTSYQANANLTDFTYTMQDIIDTVNASAESVSEETQAARSALASGDKSVVTAQMISEDVKPGEVTLIVKITAIGDSFGNLFPTTSRWANMRMQFPPVIINKSNYTNSELFGAVGTAWEQYSGEGTVLNIGATGSLWMLKGLWEVSTYIQYAAWADNLHDGTNPVPMYVMTTVGGGNDDVDFLTRNDAGNGSYYSDSFNEEFIIDSHVFTSNYQDRLITRSDGTTLPADSDFYTHEVKSKFIINNWRHAYFTLHTYAQGGTGAGPFGSPCVFGGVKEIIEYGDNIGKSYNFTSGGVDGIDSDVVRINGVELSQRLSMGYNIAANVGYDYSFGSNLGGQFDFMRGWGAGPGYVILKWLGATQPESYYYYGGDGIGVGNL
tara:strand:- start:5348 stop:6541 length:1194 start_codon:yes stop_codon:yes gene_type:complete